MGKLIVLVLGLGVAAANKWIVNENRACPDGYFYAGESTLSNASNTKSLFWEKGEISPVYSCYKFIMSKPNFASASLECNDGLGQLVSINDFVEEDILESELFVQHFIDEMANDLRSAGETSEVMTSGILLTSDQWTWLGTAEPVNEKISAEIETFNQTETVQCLAMRWESMNSSVVLTYSAVPCMQTVNISLCEVHVQTQTWYGWMYTNWMQILFFITVTILLISSCCMFQSLFFRTTNIHRRGMPQGHQGFQQRQSIPVPPPYTPNPQYAPTHADNTIPNSYVQRGREMLARVTFFRPRELEKVDLSRA